MHFGQWTFLDFFFAGFILISTILALRKGLVRELVSLGALIGGFILAILYYPVVGRRLAEFCRTEAVANLLGFVILFLGCLLLGAVVSYLINRFLKAASLEWIDRVLGAIYGILRGWAICSILVIALVAFPVRENLALRSFLAPYLLAGARAAVLLVPQGLKDKFNEQYHKVLHSWSPGGGA